MHNEKTSLTEYIPNLNTNVGNSERIVSAVAGGALLAYGIKRRDTVGVLLSLVGGGLAFRGATGHCNVYEQLNRNTANPEAARATRIHVQKSVTINKSAAELYAFWSNFENLPQFMNHLESVTTTGEKTSHWKAKAPLGTTVEWDAEVTSEVENEKIGWKSAEIADVPNSGVVEFNETKNRGTEVRVTLTYEPPAGKIGALIAKLFGEEPSQQVADDLRRFKRLMETGLIMKVEGQPSGRAEDRPKAMKAKA
jgi:uncharacterized membrane protein